MDEVTALDPVGPSRQVRTETPLCRCQEGTWISRDVVKGQSNSSCRKTCGPPSSLFVPFATRSTLDNPGLSPDARPVDHLTRSLTSRSAVALPAPPRHPWGQRSPLPTLKHPRWLVHRKPETDDRANSTVPIDFDEFSCGNLGLGLGNSMGGTCQHSKGLGCMS